MFVARYDLRAPHDTPAERSARYRTAVDQARWCEANGFDLLVVSEHHGVDDGYLPSPLILASAFAGATSTIGISVAALLAALHDPIALAEDIAVLDHVAGGRVSYVFGLGYRREEYELFGRPWAERGRLIESTITTLQRAWTGEPFEHEGRTVRVTPTPLSQPHPILFYGGGSKAAAGRAARLGLHFFPQVAEPWIADHYTAECERLGRPPGLVMQAPPGPANVFCAEDPDAFWADAGPHLLHDARAYATWQADNASAVLDTSTTVEAMREAGVYVVWSPEELVHRCRTSGLTAVTTNPLCGGLPPELSWSSLRLIGERVIPALRG